MVQEAVGAYRTASRASVCRGSADAAASAAIAISTIGMRRVSLWRVAFGNGRRRRDDDRAMRGRLKALTHEWRRFGHRRLHVLLEREGWAVNKKRVQRIYREERLMVRRRGGRKRALGLRAPLQAPKRSNA